MTRLFLLVLGLLTSACAYTGHDLRNAGAGGTAAPADVPRAQPEQQDPRFQEPIRPGRTTVK